ncbi:MAG: DMT family transporter [Granulosicoccus sp.]|nr:DMT family transporter [Granulosicoccus sp.]
MLEPRMLAATGLAIAVAVFGAIDSIIVRVLTESLHPFTIVFFRGLFGLLFIAPWVLRDPTVLVTHYRFLHLFRAALKMLSLVAFFIAISMAALSDVTAIAFTTPVFLTLGAWFFLREKPVLVRVLAVLISFIGVLVVLRPGQSALNSPLLWALAGAILTAAIQLILKIMSKNDSTEALVSWNLIAMLPISAVPLIWFWTKPDTYQLVLLAAQGSLGAINMGCMAKALSMAQASYLAPFEFLRLPVVALLAYLLFAEVPYPTTFAGGGIIFISTLLLVRTVNR